MKFLPDDYGYTVTGLQKCLVDHLKKFLVNDLFKCPDANEPPNVTRVPIIIYPGVIPSAILSDQGMQDPPIVPTIVVECHRGKCDIPHRPDYLITTRLLIALWDDDETYSAYMDSQNISEKVFLNLMKHRSLNHQFNVEGPAEWTLVNTNHAQYYVSVITLTYNLEQVPDETDNIDYAIQQDDNVSKIR